MRVECLHECTSTLISVVCLYLQTLDSLPVHKKWQYPRGLLAVIGPYTQYIVSETCIAICSIAQDVAFFVNSFIESLRGSLATNLSKFGLSAATGETRFYAIYTPGLYFYCLWRIFHFLSRGFERPPPPPKCKSTHVTIWWLCTVKVFCFTARATTTRPLAHFSFI